MSGKIKKFPVSPDDHPLVALCKERGNHATDLRDAAHEIFHARTAGTRSWDREVVNRALIKHLARALTPAHLWVHEMKARAVEQLVCKHFGVEIKPLEDWIHNSILEALKRGLPYAEMDLSLPIATQFMTDKRVVAEAEAIIALAKRKPRRPRSQATSQI